MIKPQGYDEVSAAEVGTSVQLPAGNYVCKVMNAIEKQSASGKNMLVLSLDIAEGEFKDFFAERYRNSTFADKKWGCTYNQLTEGNSTQYFKGMIKAIEESNSGYSWNWDENTLKGKLIGVQFGREEFKGSDGNYNWSCKPRFVCSVGKLKDKDVLKDKPMANKQTDTFVDAPVADETDLPF